MGTKHLLTTHYTALSLDLKLGVPPIIVHSRSLTVEVPGGTYRYTNRSVG